MIKKKEADIFEFARFVWFVCIILIFNGTADY